MTNSSLEALRVLIVDDEAFVRDVAARVLTGLGVRNPSQAENGRDALAHLEAEPSDVIICDLMMPDMDGVELVRHLSAHESPPAVLFMSGAQSSLRRVAESLGRAYGLTVLGSLPKPVTRPALENALRDIGQGTAEKRASQPIAITPDQIERAIEHNEFCYYFQPKVSIARQSKGGVDSVEALARWRHPEHGLLSPAFFIALAESGPLIVPLTEQLVLGGLRQLAQWHEKGISISMAMNLSPSMLSDVSMPDRFARAAADLSLSPGSVTFEITETGVAENEAIYLEIIARLQMKGFRLSIDDFGTGQSSLQKLEALPFAELKVDRQFVHGLHKSDAKRAIFEASIALARRFGLKTVAEGVEDQADFEVLRQSDCDVAQGFFVSKPLSAKDAETWIAVRGSGK